MWIKSIPSRGRERENVHDEVYSSSTFENSRKRGGRGFSYEKSSGMRLTAAPSILPSPPPPRHAVSHSRRLELLSVVPMYFFSRCEHAFSSPSFSISPALFHSSPIFRLFEHSSPFPQRNLLRTICLALKARRDPEFHLEHCPRPFFAIFHIHGDERSFLGKKSRLVFGRLWIQEKDREGWNSIWKIKKGK